MILNGQQTERLHLRSLSFNDYDALMQFYGDPEVSHYYFFENTPEVNCKKGIEKQLSRYKTYNTGLAALILKETTELIGMCGLLHQQIENKQRLEVGYGLMRKHWGKGFASEAAQFCRDFAFQNNMSDTLISVIHPKNINSQKVALKNGMSHTSNIDFKGHTTYLFEITKKEWLNL